MINPRDVRRLPGMGKKKAAPAAETPPAHARPSALVDTRVIYCGDNREQLPKLPDACVDLIYIDPPFNSNRNYEVFWGETREKRSFDDRHASTAASIDFTRPICVELARVPESAGSSNCIRECIWQVQVLNTGRTLNIRLKGVMFLSAA